jgi:hypothetical protein
MQDVTTSAVALIVFSIVTVTVLGVASAIGSVPYFANSTAFAQAEAALAMMDYVGILLTTGLFVTSIGLAALSRNNRVFLPVSLLVLVIDVVLAAVFSDVFVSLTEKSFLASGASTLGVTSLIASNLPLVIGVLGVVVIIALYTNLGGGRRATR